MLGDITNRYGPRVRLEDLEDYLDATYISPPTSPVKPTVPSYLLALLHQGAPASRLPHDVLTRIFTFHFADDDDERSRKKLRRRKRVALVCRSWRAPAQRRIFSEVHVRCINKLVAFTRMVAESKTGVGAYVGMYVKTLHLNLSNSSPGDGRLLDSDVPKEVDRLFRMLPYMIELRLRLGKSFVKANFSRLLYLPQLRTIALDMATFDKDLIAFRQILGATPEIKSLTLSNDHSGIHTPTLKKRLPYVHFENLRHLSLQSTQFCGFLDTMEFLSSGSLEIINHLELCRRGPELKDLSSIGLLLTVGNTLKTLTLGRLEEGHTSELKARESDEAILESCNRIKTLIAREPLDLTYIPQTLTKIIFYCDFLPKAGWVLHEAMHTRGGGASQKVEDWENVKRFEVHCGRMSDGGRWNESAPKVYGEEVAPLKEFFEERGVEVVVNGITL